MVEVNQEFGIVDIDCLGLNLCLQDLENAMRVIEFGIKGVSKE